MIKKYAQKLNIALLAVVIPTMYGCGGGGGGGILDLAGFLFGGALGFGSSGGGAGLLGGSLPSGAGGLGAGAGGLGAAGGAIGTIVNPEPATMLLLGSGVTAMAYFKSKNDKKNS